MKTYSFYGLGIAFLYFVMAEIFNVTGMHADPAKLGRTNIIAGIAGLTIFVVMLLLAMRDVRNGQSSGSAFTYGAAFKVGILTTLFAALGSIVTNYIYTQLINPDLGDVIVRAQVDEMRAKGMPEGQISQATEMMKRFSHPLISAVFSFISSMVLGTIVALIVAIFVRRKAQIVEPPVISSGSVS